MEKKQAEVLKASKTKILGKYSYWRGHLGFRKDSPADTGVLAKGGSPCKVGPACF